MAKNRKGLGCLAKTLIALLVILVILVAAVVTVLHLTPAQLHLADVSIAGTTLADMGLADTKLIDVIKAYLSLKKPDTEAIVTNPPSEEDKAAAADKVTSGATLPKDEDGSTDFSAIVTNPVVYDKQYLITYTDKELAGLFGHIIEDAEAKANTPESIQFLADFNATVASITISDKAPDGSAKLRIVASVNLNAALAEFGDEIPDVIKGLIPEVVYFTVYGNISADAEGHVVYTQDKCLINDQQDAVSDAIFHLIAAKASLNAEDPATAIGEKVGQGFELLVYNLGRVGTASLDSNSVVIPSTKTLGSVGIQNGTLSLITVTE